jgi:hypothetical protein
MNIDYDAIEKALADMRERHKLYALVKAEMKRRGHWRNKPRGASWPKGRDPRKQGGQ